MRLSAYAGLRETIASLGIKGAFKSARVWGYNCIELLFIAHECDGILKDADEYLGAISSEGMPVSCISCYADVVSTEPPYRVNTDAIEAIKRCVDLAKIIGSPLVHHTLVTRLSGTRDNYSEVLPIAIAAADEVAVYAKERGVSVIYEPQGMLFNGLSGFSGFLDKMLEGHSNVGVCLDVGNTLWVDEDCLAITEKYATNVKHLHLKDYILGVDDTPYKTHGGKTIKEVALGRGIVDISGALQILESSGYTGAISIEDNSSSDYASLAANAKKVLGVI